jgi:predicted RND superfamily exporter protein
MHNRLLAVPRYIQQRYLAVGMSFEDICQRVFVTWAGFVNRFPYFVIAFSLLLTLACGGGLFFLNVQFSGDDLWAPQQGQFHQNSQKYDLYYGAPPEYLNMIIVAADQDDGGNVLTKSILIDAMSLADDISAQTSNVCTEPGANTSCTQIGVLDYWHWQKDALEADSDIYTTLSNGNAYGRLGNLLALEDLTSDLQTSNGRVQSAAAIKLDFYLRGDAKVVDQARSTERKYIRDMGQTSIPHTTIYYNAFVTQEDESIKSVFAGLAFLLLGYFFIAVYSVSCLGIPHPVYSRGLLALSGLASVTMAIITSFGIMGYLGVPFTVLTPVLCYIVLAVGLDDMFVLTHQYQHAQGASVEAKIEKTLAHAGMSILFTSITDMTAFFCGSFAIMPIVQYFCYYAVVAILFDFIYQVSFFLAFLVLDGRRIESYKMDALCCVTFCLPPPPSYQESTETSETSEAMQDDEPRSSSRSVTVAPSSSCTVVDETTPIDALEQSTDALVASLETESTMEIELEKMDTILFGSQETASNATKLRMDLHGELDMAAGGDPFEQSDEIEDNLRSAWSAWSALYERYMYAVDGRLTAQITWFYAWFLTNWVLRIVVLVVFTVLFLVSCYLLQFLTYGWQEKDIYLDNSYAKNYQLQREKYFEYDKATFYVVGEDEDMFELQRWEAYNALMRNLVDSSRVERIQRSWYPAFRTWCNANAAINSTLVNNLPPSKLLFGIYLKDFLASDSGKMYAADITFGLDSYSIQAWKVPFTALDLVTAKDRYDVMMEATHIVGNGSLQAFAYNQFFIWFDLDNRMLQDAAFIIISACFAVFIITLVFLLHPGAAVLVTLCVVMIDIDLLAIMVIFDIPLNSISSVNLTMAVGMAVDGCAHVAHRFMWVPGTRRQRAIRAVSELGPAVLQGASSTLVGIFFLLFAGTQIFRIFLTLAAGTVILGTAHGLIFLPVMLSICGPSLSPKVGPTTEEELDLGIDGETNSTP